MNHRKHFVKNSIALMLFVAFMLPITIQFIHVFDGHEHVTCTEKVSHVHQSTSNSDLCDYQLITYNYISLKKIDVPVSEIYVKTIENLSSLQFHSFNTTNTQLRAPPRFS